jgi:predicted ATPase
VVELVRSLDATCPQLVVLATSREGLGIAGERIVALAPLQLPATGDRDSVLRSDAGRLFVERAVSVKSDFAVTDANAAPIAEVVRRLDGIPLALELAAARVPVLSPTQLAQRLDQRFRLLSGGERGAIERHATLRAAIDWSYDLLAADRQRLLARLSVFAGGCSLEAAEAVCSAEGIDEADVLDLLAGLVARSLVQVEDAAWGERRYRLLETIRQYAEEQLAAAERSELRDRHSRFYVHFVETAARGLRGPDQLRWHQQVEPELDNLTTAMAWAIANDDAVRAERFLASAADVERAPLAAALLRNAEAVLELPSIHTIPRYPFALMAGALAALFHGNYDRAEQLCAQALAAVDRPDDELEGRTAFVRSNIARLSGDPSRAIEYQERALRYFRRFAGPYHLVRVLNVLAAMRTGVGYSAKAADEAREALNLARQIGNPGLTSGALVGLAYVLANVEPQRSRALIAESLERNDRLGGIAVDEFALVLTIGASAMLGERDQVLRLAARALDRGLSAVIRLVPCLESTANALAAEAPAAAAVLHGSVDALAPHHLQSEPHRTFRERATAVIHAQLDADRVVELHAQGGAMTQTEVAAYAIDAIARVLRDESHDQSVGFAAGTPDATCRPSLRRRDAIWDIGYRGEAATVTDSKGLRDLATLLSRPGVDVHVLELVGSPIGSGASIEMVDRTALAQYRQRLADLDDDIAEAEHHHDTERIARAEAEREALLDELRTVSGLGGQSRLTGAHAGERARKAVSARIKVAIGHLETPMPQLAAHLDEAIITGTWCRYRADMAENWDVKTG